MTSDTSDSQMQHRASIISTGSDSELQLLQQLQQVQQSFHLRNSQHWRISYRKCKCLTIILFYSSCVMHLLMHKFLLLWLVWLVTSLFTHSFLFMMTNMLKSSRGRGGSRQVFQKIWNKSRAPDPDGGPVGRRATLSGKWSHADPSPSITRSPVTNRSIILRNEQHSVHIFRGNLTFFYTDFCNFFIFHSILPLFLFGGSRSSLACNLILDSDRVNLHSSLPFLIRFFLFLTNIAFQQNKMNRTEGPGKEDLIKSSSSDPSSAIKTGLTVCDARNQNTSSSRLGGSSASTITLMLTMPSMDASEPPRDPNLQIVSSTKNENHNRNNNNNNNNNDKSGASEKSLPTKLPLVDGVIGEVDSTASHEVSNSPSELSSASSYASSTSEKINTAVSLCNKQKQSDPQTSEPQPPPTPPQISVSKPPASTPASSTNRHETRLSNKIMNYLRVRRASHKTRGGSDSESGGRRSSKGQPSSRRSSSQPDITGLSVPGNEEKEKCGLERKESQRRSSTESAYNRGSKDTDSNGGGRRNLPKSRGRSRIASESTATTSSHSGLTASDLNFSSSHDLNHSVSKSRALAKIETSMVKTIATTRILNILRHWITKHSQDFLNDPQLLRMTQDFLQDLVHESNLVAAEQKSASQLLQILSRDIIMSKRVDLVQLLTPPSLPSRDSIESLSALEVAEGMTLLDHKIFVCIQSEEFLGQGMYSRLLILIMAVVTWCSCASAAMSKWRLRLMMTAIETDSRMVLSDWMMSGEKRSIASERELARFHYLMTPITIIITFSFIARFLEYTIPPLIMMILLSRGFCVFLGPFPGSVMHIHRMESGLSWLTFPVFPFDMMICKRQTASSPSRWMTISLPSPRVLYRHCNDRAWLPACLHPHSIIFIMTTLIQL